MLRFWPLAVVLAAAVLFRWPAIAHATETNSDAAIVGLQAMHILRGEWSPFLWGSGYQSSVDSAFAALSFGFLGATARALLFSSLGLHLALTSLAWSTLARRLDPMRAALAVWPLVFTSSPLQTYILYPPRQAALTIAIASVWALDRAADARTARAFVAGGALLTFACFADPYALVLVPPIGVFGLTCAVDRERGGSLARLAGLAMGAVVGALPLVLLRTSARATHGQLALDLAVAGRNARLLAETLPWTVGAKAWQAPASGMDYVPWEGPLAARALAVAGGTLFLVAIAAGGACVFARRLRWEVRRLAVLGGLALPVTIGAYLVSPMVFDIFSARYLAAIPLLAPFAFAPLAAIVDRRLAPLLAAPSAAAAAIAGWVGYGPFLRARPGDADELRLEAGLAVRGVHYAMADYWAAYRLTFLTAERLIVVPMNRAEDRYPPYQAAFDAATTVAYVFDPERSRESEVEMGGLIRAEDGLFETLYIGRFTALVFRRTEPR